MSEDKPPAREPIELEDAVWAWEDYAQKFCKNPGSCDHSGDFMAWLQSVKAQAWDEGWEASSKDYFTSAEENMIRNPYRTEESN